MYNCNKTTYLCIIERSNKKYKPSHNCLKKLNATPSSNLLYFLMYVDKSPPRHRSRTRNMYLVFSKLSCNPTIRIEKND